MRKRYPSDLSDRQWKRVAPLFETQREDKRGRPREHSPRELLNGILYVMREGCSWRGLPGDLPCWKTVFSQRQRWTEDGTLQRAMGALARAQPPASASSIPPSLSRLMAAQAPHRAATSAP